MLTNLASVVVVVVAAAGEALLEQNCPNFQQHQTGCCSHSAGPSRMKARVTLPYVAVVAGNLASVVVVVV